MVVAELAVFLKLGAADEEWVDRGKERASGEKKAGSLTLNQLKRRKFTSSSMSIIVKSS